MPQKSALPTQWRNYFKILPHCCVDYTLWRHHDHDVTYIRPKKNKSNGLVSEKAGRRMRTALNWMLLFSQRKFVYSISKKKGFWFKLNFATLTLSSAQCHPDSYIVEHMLQPLLRWLQRQCGVVNYVWKAETQDNGNIHFHITLNKFVHYKKLRNKWNELQLNHDYIGTAPGTTVQPDPNSTDIKSVINTAKIIGYFTHYMSKKDEEKKDVSFKRSLVFCNSTLDRELAYMSIAAAGITFAKRKVTCKVWGCSHNLSNMQVLLSESQDEYYKAKQHHKDNYCRLIAEDGIIRIYAHKTKIDDGVHPLIADGLNTAYQLFMMNDDEVTKYQME